MGKPDGSEASARSAARANRAEEVALAVEAPMPPVARAKRLRLFSAPRHRPRKRRPTDLVLLVLAAGSAALLVAAAQPPSGFEAALTDLAGSIPSAFDVVWKVAAGVGLGWAVLLIVLTVIRWRLDLVRDLVLAAAGGAALAVGVDELWLGGTIARIGDGLWSVGPPAQAVSVRLAVVVATLVAASPQLTHPFRRFSRVLVAAGAVSLVILGATTPSGAVIGLLCGTIGAAVVHLLFGSPAGQPSTREVADALTDLGIHTGSLHEMSSEVAGVTLFETARADGAPLLVKVYGRDAWDSQLVAKLWRRLWYRECAAPTLTRLQQAEHEAFVTLLAERAGVPVVPVISAGSDASNDALVVLRQAGTPMPSDLGGRPEILDALWSAAEALHHAGIAHRDLAPERFRLAGSEVLLGGFEGAVASPSDDQLSCDRAQLVVTSALIGGVDDTIAIAARRMGSAGLAAVEPYLQMPALGRTLRDDVRSSGLDLDALRTAVASAAGTEAAEPAELRRVSGSALVQAVLLTVGAYFLISSLAGVDFAQVWEQVQDAVWVLLVVALLLGQTPRFAQAVSARGACPRDIAYGPVALLEFAITFINLVLPSTAARVATNVRFFQRQGIPAASAMAIGIIDSLGGFAVQLMILGAALLVAWGDIDLQMPDDSGDGTLLALLIAVAAAVIVAAFVSLLFPAVRHRVRAFVEPHLAEVRATLTGLRSPAKIAQVIGGNLASEVLFACTFAIVLSAFHSPVPLGTLLVINVCVSLFAGLMPVPGGIGVTEGALMFGLTAAGVDQATAFAATMCYRLITFYLPPIWGGATFHHMERAGLL